MSRAPHNNARLRALAAQAGVGVLIDVGRRHALFAHLDSRESVTAEAFAARANLDVGFVRDWLDGLVLGRFVEHDGRRDTYRALPELGALRALIPPPSDHAEVHACELGPAPLDRLRALHATLAPGDVVRVIEFAAADCVADNLDHPLGAGLYAASLLRRERGGAGVMGVDTLRALMRAAGFTVMRMERAARGAIDIVIITAAA